MESKSQVAKPSTCPSFPLLLRLFLAHLPLASIAFQTALWTSYGLFCLSPVGLDASLPRSLLLMTDALLIAIRLHDSHMVMTVKGGSVALGTLQIILMCTSLPPPIH